MSVWTANNGTWGSAANWSGDVTDPTDAMADFMSCLNGFYILDVTDFSGVTLTGAGHLACLTAPNGRLARQSL
jgi:hypothetical protein